MKISFVDTGVLIAAVRGTPEVLTKARTLLTDPDRTFASSDFVRLEVFPKALFHKRQLEHTFYRSFFSTVQYWAPPSETLVRLALEVATRVGLSCLDALHVAAAIEVGADELITTEKLSKPIHRVDGITVKTLRS